jgi:hypothetical protein
VSYSGIINGRSVTSEFPYVIAKGTTVVGEAEYLEDAKKIQAQQPGSEIYAWSVDRSVWFRVQKRSTGFGRRDIHTAEFE